MSLSSSAISTTAMCAPASLLQAVIQTSMNPGPVRRGGFVLSGCPFEVFATHPGDAPKDFRPGAATANNLAGGRPGGNRPNGDDRISDRGPCSLCCSAGT